MDAGGEHGLASDTPAPASTLATQIGRASGSQLTRWLYASGFLVAVIIVAATAIMLANLRERQLANTKRELQNLVLALSEQMVRTFDAVELVQNSLSEPLEALRLTTDTEFRQHVSAQSVHLTLKHKTSGLPYITALTFISADGELLNSSLSWPLALVDVTDREYFNVLKSNPQLTSFIGRPVQNRALDTWTIHVARAVRGSDNKLLGLVLATMELRYFERAFAAIALAPGSSISLLRNDGVLFARYPPIEGSVGRTYTRLIAALADTNQATLRLVSKVDGKDRLVAAQRLVAYPLITTISVEVSAALAAWRELALSILAAAGVLMVVITSIICVAAYQVASRLRGQALQFDTAINNMLQGLVMFDAGEQIVVVNGEYIRMYDLSPDIVKPGCTVRELFKHRAERGHLRRDPDEYRLELLAMISQGTRSSIIVETDDGREIAITNQPMSNGGWLSTHEDITERRKADAKISHMALHDALTNLPNRLFFREQIENRLACLPRDQKFALLCLDLDGFKKVNDTLGHPFGDKLLRQFAERITGCVREVDAIARLGGDEFAILQGEFKGPSDAIGLADRLIEVASAPFDLDGQHALIGVSIGIAVAPNDAADPDQLLKNADLALYRAKADGRGTYRFFEPEMDALMQARRTLELDLRKAIVNGEFELFYQPLVNLQRQEITGFEALIRWNHPERGLVAPLDFVPLTEETGLIVPIGEWVLRQACREAMNWPDQLSIAVNLSPAQFKTRNLPQLVVSALAQSGLPAERLELEITESVLLVDNESTVETLHQLRNLGVRISMDDFGVGYSSLSYLRSFPFDKIKIDRVFVRDLASSADSQAIVRAVVGLGSSLGMTTTAEGVEAQEELDYLKELGCTEAQGYIFGRPSPARDVLARMSKHLVPAKDAA